MEKEFVAVIAGSPSDRKILEAAGEMLARLKIPHELHILSAHRSPAALHEYIRTAEQRGCQVFIGIAGMAAHLAGNIAAQTLKPVIGVPVDASLAGMDALLATVQMPAGIPVAAMAVGTAGARNAAHLAAQILALGDAKLAQRISQERKDAARRVEEADAALQTTQPA